MRRSSAIGWGVLVLLVALGDVHAEAFQVGSTPLDPEVKQASDEGAVVISTMDQLIRLSQPQLDSLYMQAGPGTVPPGRVKGRVIYNPGSRITVPASKVARFMWQGKTFNPEDSTAINRFFGIKIIRGKTYQGESWLDGRPSLILDYAETSRLYRPYRDEIREVAPGLYLGLMYERTTPQATFKMYFALEAVQ
ncbi:hypothetical protein [Singulisphaera sp. PoT]|uniref:hypothetical protein n=1 Tax=Singulisphaera sp. PoT TaxID=3411797 RepID=UPI003BF5F674